MMAAYYNGPSYQGHSYQVKEKTRFAGMQDPYTETSTFGYHPDPWPSDYHNGPFIHSNDNDYTIGQHMPHTSGSGPDIPYDYSYYGQQQNAMNSIAHGNVSPKIYHHHQPFNDGGKRANKNGHGHGHGHGYGHDHSKKHNDSTALSALTLLSFFFFINLLQNCIKDHMDAMNPTVVVMTGGVIRKNSRENMPRNDKITDYIDYDNEDAADYSATMKPQKSVVINKNFNGNINQPIYNKSHDDLQTAIYTAPDYTAHYAAEYPRPIIRSSQITPLYNDSNRSSTLESNEHSESFYGPLLSSSSSLLYRHDYIEAQQSTPFHNYMTSMSLRPIRRASIIPIKSRN